MSKSINSKRMEIKNLCQNGEIMDVLTFMATNIDNYRVGYRVMFDVLHSNPKSISNVHMGNATLYIDIGDLSVMLPRQCNLSKPTWMSKGAPTLEDMYWIFCKNILKTEEGFLNVVQ